MSRAARRAAFTLLELVAVITLLALTVGVSTIGLAGLSDEGKLEAAASQIGAVVRIASCAATRSGKPRMLQFDHRGYVVKKPVRRDGQWAWSSAPRTDLVSRVRITNVFPSSEGPDTRRSGPPWMMVVHPGALHCRRGFQLELANGKQGIVGIDGLTAIARIELVTESWD